MIYLPFGFHFCTVYFFINLIENIPIIKFLHKLMNGVCRSGNSCSLLTLYGILYQDSVRFSMQLFSFNGICLLCFHQSKENFLKKVNISKTSLAFEMHTRFLMTIMVNIYSRSSRPMF